MERPAAQRMGAARRDDDHDELHRLGAGKRGLSNHRCGQGYISEINGVAEKRNGEYSGWMGTLNDWFTNYGFDQYTTTDGTLQDGDEIRVMYTSTGMNIRSSCRQTRRR